MPVLKHRTKLPRPDDPGILEPLFEHLANGVPLRYASVLVGISESTAYHWVSEGGRLVAGLQEQGEELGSTALFAQTVIEARAQCVATEIEDWNNAAVNAWAKHATKLERLFPGDFGRRTEVRVEGEVAHRLELPPGYQAAVPYIEAQSTPLALPEVNTPGGLQNQDPALGPGYAESTD